MVLGGACGCTLCWLHGAGGSRLPGLFHTRLHRERAVDRYSLYSVYAAAIQRPRIRPRRSRVQTLEFYSLYSFIQYSFIQFCSFIQLYSRTTLYTIQHKHDIKTGRSRPTPTALLPH